MEFETHEQYMKSVANTISVPQPCECSRKYGEQYVSVRPLCVVMCLKCKKVRWITDQF